MAHLQITHLVGKRGLNNAWIVEPPQAAAITDKLQEALQSNLTCRVQIRPSLLAPEVHIASEIEAATARCLREIRASKRCTVLMQPGRLDKASRRHINAVTQTYEVGQVYEVAAPAAFRLLNADPYRYVFEEVLDASSQPPARPKQAADASAVAELLEQNRHLMERLAALEVAQQKPTTKKRTLKDSLAAQADADAANEEG